MDIFDRLIDASKNRADLQSFLEDNIEELYDFLLTQSFSDLSLHKEKIERYILPNLKIIRQLDFGIESTIVFTLLLLDTAERFGFLMPFQQLYKLLVKNNCKIGSRLEASALYLIGIGKISDYESIIDPLLCKLAIAYQVEDDIEDKVVGTLVNFYAQVVHNFAMHNLEGVLSIKGRILQKSDESQFYFIKSKFFGEILNIDIRDHISGYIKIQELLDSFLKRTKKYFPFNREGVLIEKGTHYSNLLSNIESNFNSIRRISVDQYNLIADDSIFYSLKSGVKILTEESQLFAYLYSYGEMHYKKLESSFEFLPTEILNSEINIIDWGCGQGLATMTFLDYINAKRLKTKIKNVILIEPSEIALKRAALHVSKFNTSIGLQTINKDFDSLKSIDFNNKRTDPKLHLFSNIIDIEFFSLSDLLNLINSTFKGENYFVCVSPYINYLKTGRLDRFMKSFAKNNDFKELISIDNEKGSWSGTSWSRVIRVFKATL